MRPKDVVLPPKRASPLRQMTFCPKKRKRIWKGKKKIVISKGNPNDRWIYNSSELAGTGGNIGKVRCGMRKKGSKGLMHYSPTSVRVGSLIEARQPATIAFASHVVEGSCHVPVSYLVFEPQGYVRKVLGLCAARVVSSGLGFWSVCPVRRVGF